MFLHVKKAKYIKNYIIWLQFNNGIEGQINLKNELHGEIFAELKDINKFKKFKVDKEVETIVWKNGADIAPEFLYNNLMKKP